MKNQILLLFMLLLTSCTSNKIKDEKPKKEPIKKIEYKSNLSIAKNYRIDGNFIYYYTPDGKLIKNRDLITRTEMYFDDKEDFVKKEYNPRLIFNLSSKENVIYEERIESYNLLGMPIKTEVAIYGMFNHLVLYKYDEILRITEKAYVNYLGDVYLKKKYSYKDNYYLDKIETYKDKKLIEEEKYIYENGRVTKIMHKDTFKGEQEIEALIYKKNKLIEKKSKYKTIRYSYNSFDIKEAKIYANEKLESKIEYIYNEHNELIKKKFKDRNNKEKLIRVYEY